MAEDSAGAEPGGTQHTQVFFLFLEFPELLESWAFSLAGEQLWKDAQVCPEWWVQLEEMNGRRIPIKGCVFLIHIYVIGNLSVSKVMDGWLEGH